MDQTLPDVHALQQFRASALKPALRGGTSERRRRAAQGFFKQSWRQRHRLPELEDEEALEQPTCFDETQLRFDRLTTLPQPDPRDGQHPHRAGGEDSEQASPSSPAPPRPRAIVSNVEGMPVRTLWTVEGLPLDEEEAARREAQVQECGLRKARFFDRYLRADRDLPVRQLRWDADASQVPSPRTPAQSSRAVEAVAPSASAPATARLPDVAPSLAHLGDTMAGLVRSCSAAKLLPVTTGIIRGEGDCLTLEHACMTDARAEAMAGTIRASSSNVRQAHLASNGLSEKGAADLLHALPEGVELVDLSHNVLAPEFKHPEKPSKDGLRPQMQLGQDVHRWCQALGRLPNLQTLKISDCQLNDAVCRLLCEKLVACQQLTSLDLSGNNIYQGGAAVGALVSNHRALLNLDIHWNQISGDSARELARGIHENGSLHGVLRAIDLSWNPLGKARLGAPEGSGAVYAGSWANSKAPTRRDPAPPPPQAGGEETCHQLGIAFQLGKLEHVDLRNCELSVALCNIIASYLRDNTTVMGIHMEGNGSTQGVGEARTDPYGFLVVPEPKAPPEPVEGGARQAAAQPDDPGGDSVPPPVGHAGVAGTEVSLTVQVAPPSCCWVCGGWRETRLSYTPGISGKKPPAGEPDVWVFTSADSFQKGLKLTKSGEELVTYLMAPPGQLLYIFQVGAELLTSVTSKLCTPTPVTQRAQRVQRMPMAEEVAGSSLEVEVLHFNSLQVPRRQDWEPVCQWMAPRRPGEFRSDGGRPASWSVENSIFAQYEDPLQKHSFSDRCFEADWRMITAHELMDNFEEQTEVRDLLKRAYGEVQALYASLCSVDWELANTAGYEQLGLGVSLNEYAHLLVQGALLSDDFNLHEADALFVISAAPVAQSSRTWHPSAQSGGRLLPRAGLLDILVRLSVLVANRTRQTPSKALQVVLNKNLLALRKTNFKCLRQWRLDAMHTESVEAVCRKHSSSVLQPLFNAFAEPLASAPEAEEGERRQARASSSHLHRMSLQGWFSLLDALGTLSYRDAAEDQRTNLWDRVWLFKASLMGHVDETRSDDHLRMTLVEFSEAITRLMLLTRYRARASSATTEEAEKWDYGLGEVCPAAIFMIDKEEVMDQERVAKLMDEFLSSATVKAAVSKCPR